MQRLKKIFKWLKNPHGFSLILIYIVAILSIASAMLVLFLGVLDSSHGILAYALFAVAAISLAYSIYTVVLVAPKVKQKITLQAQKNKFAKSLLQNYGFRTIVFSIFSLAISIGYAVFNGVIGIVSSSIWYGALAAYYILLAFMRGGVLFYHKKERTKSDVLEFEAERKMREVKTYRTCGAVLIVLPLALLVAIAQMVGSDKSFVHAGFTIYVAAMYSFYKIIMSIINFVKARKNNDMTVQAVRNINLADAMVSILALQTAMFREFSQGINSGAANALTGAAVCVLTMALGIFMLINASLKLGKINRGLLK